MNKTTLKLKYSPSQPLNKRFSLIYYRLKKEIIPFIKIRHSKFIKSLTWEGIILKKDTKELASRAKYIKKLESMSFDNGDLLNPKRSSILLRAFRFQRKNIKQMKKISSPLLIDFPYLTRLEFDSTFLAWKMLRYHSHYTELVIYLRYKLFDSLVKNKKDMNLIERLKNQFVNRMARLGSLKKFIIKDLDKSNSYVVSEFLQKLNKIPKFCSTLETLAVSHKNSLPFDLDTKEAGSLIDHILPPLSNQLYLSLCKLKLLFRESEAFSVPFSLLAKLENLREISLTILLPTKREFQKFLIGFSLPSSIESLDMRLLGSQESDVFVDYRRTGLTESEKYFGGFLEKWENLLNLKNLKLILYQKETQMNNQSFVTCILSKLKGLEKFSYENRFSQSLYSEKTQKIEHLDLKNLIQRFNTQRTTLKEVVLRDINLSLKSFDTCQGIFPNISKFEIEGKIYGGENLKNLLLSLPTASENTCCVKINDLILDGEPSLKSFIDTCLQKIPKNWDLLINPLVKNVSTEILIQEVQKELALANIQGVLSLFFNGWEESIYGVKSCVKESAINNKISGSLWISFNFTKEVIEINNHIMVMNNF